MLHTLKKIFFPKEVDKEVESINAESKAMLEEASVVAARYNRLLKKNGVTLQIYIATGGDRRGR